MKNAIEKGKLIKLVFFYVKNVNIIKFFKNPLKSLDSLGGG